MLEGDGDGVKSRGGAAGDGLSPATKLAGSISGGCGS